MRLGPPLLAVVLLAPAAAVPGALPAAGCVRLLREARIAAEQGNPERQLDLLRRAAKDYPKEILPALALVEYPDRTRLDANELGRARAVILDRLLDPGALLPYSALGRIAEDPAVSPVDRAALKKALETRLVRSPADPDLLEALARVVGRLPDRDAERAVLERLDAVRPSVATAWRRAGLAEDLGRGDEALRIYVEIRSRYGDSPVLGEAIGRSLVALRRFEEAKREGAALEADPPGRAAAGRVSVALAWALWDDGKGLEAQAAFRDAMRANPDNEEAAEALRTLFATADERAALAASEAERLDRVRDPVALLEAGATLLLAGDAASAAGLLRRAVEASPGLEMAWFDLGVAALRLDRWEEAREAFARAGALKPDRPETFLYLGEALLKLDRFREAVAPLRRALALRPALPEAHASLSDCYRRMGEADQADRELRLATPYP
jgi:tetratricopeptide (TPR) repeat protein